MAIDKLVDSSQLDNNLTSVANAIRTKGGTSASLTFPSDFVSAINAISGGGSTLITKSITANGTYSAEDDDADGYSEVTVNVPSGAASSWTKVAETSYQVSTTSTSAGTVATWATGHSELWTSDKLVFVRVRDTAGKRAGYFYGSDTFYYNIHLVNGSSATYITTLMGSIIRYATDGNFAVTLVTSGNYGVFPDRLYPDGNIRVRSRYSSSQSLTINGTYKVEVYLLDPAGGVPIFA